MKRRQFFKRLSQFSLLGIFSKDIIDMESPSRAVPAIIPTTEPNMCLDVDPVLTCSQAWYSNKNNIIGTWRDDEAFNNIIDMSNND